MWTFFCNDIMPNGTSIHRFPFSSPLKLFIILLFSISIEPHFNVAYANDWIYGSQVANALFCPKKRKMIVNVEPLPTRRKCEKVKKYQLQIQMEEWVRSFNIFHPNWFWMMIWNMLRVEETLKEQIKSIC